MKRYLLAFLILTVFGLFLSFPEQVFYGAKSGLLLWFQIMIPTLFPFLVLSNLVLNTSTLHTLSKLFSPVFGRLFHVSSYGSLAVFVGFLCGYPMGSKIAADLTEKGYITSSEGQYLLSFCNNTSPSFMVSFLIWQTLHLPERMLPTLLILFSAPFTVSLFTRKIHRPASMYASDQTASFIFRKSLSGREILDHCMTDSFESMLKIGFYMMFFSIMIAFCRLRFPGTGGFISLMISSLELANGLTVLSKLHLTRTKIYIFSLALTSFGGWCAVAQTYAMIQHTKLKLFPYIIEKLATMLVTSLYAYCYLKFF